VRHWLAGGATRLENLVLLCSRHHRLLHEGGCSVQRTADGGLLFVAGDGKRMDAVPTAESIESSQADLQNWAAEHGLEIGPDTNLPWWDGAAPDYDWIISALFSEPRVPAPQRS
jgi:hypothetical protein